MSGETFVLQHFLESKILQVTIISQSSFLWQNAYVLYLTFFSFFSFQFLRNYIYYKYSQIYYYLYWVLILFPLPTPSSPVQLFDAVKMCVLELDLILPLPIPPHPSPNPPSLPFSTQAVSLLPFSSPTAALFLSWIARSNSLAASRAVGCIGMLTFVEIEIR